MLEKILASSRPNAKGTVFVGQGRNFNHFANATMKYLRESSFETV
jgi:hypothetical protein